MTNDEIKELIRLVTDTGIAELEVERGENRVRIRKSFAPEATVYVPSAAPAPAPVAAPYGHKAEVTTAPAPAAPPKDTLVYVKSPIVGTFYEAASPTNPAFVRIGEEVSLGKVLCIIESMKLMNEIETDVAGIIEVRLVQNGQPVEYGEALFGIRPL